MTSGKKQVHIVGGGYSGLTAGYFLARAGFQVRIFERAERLGGLLGTHHLHYGLAEQAANAFLANAQLEQISADIKVPLYAKTPIAQRRYIYLKGRPRQWPLGWQALYKFPSFAGKYYFLRHSLKPSAGESLASWGRRHLGQQLLENVLGPAMQGVYVGQPDELSAALLLQDMFSPSPMPKGRLRGSVAPALGMGQWINGLKDYLLSKGGEIVTKQPMSLDDCRVPTVLATDLQSAQQLLAATPYYKGLQQAAALDITSVTIYLPADARRPPRGFGCLFPKHEGFNALGVLYNNDIFAGRSHNALSETWIFASAEQESAYLPKVLSDRRRLVGGDAVVLDCHVFCWPNKIPLYNPALEKILIELAEEEGNIFLMGNYLGHLGLAKIIHRAEQLTKKIRDQGRWQSLV